jgi:hypothetical protein
VQLVCGNASVICPAMAAQPSPVTPGFYSVGSSNGTMQTNQFSCPAAVTRSLQSVYCPGDGLMHPCPPGRFGNSTATGLNSSLCSAPCPAGFYCPANATTEKTLLPCGGLQWYVTSLCWSASARALTTAVFYRRAMKCYGLRLACSSRRCCWLRRCPCFVNRSVVVMCCAGSAR